MTDTRSVSAAQASPGPSGRVNARRLRPWIVGALIVAAATCVAIYLFTGLPTRWEYALDLRWRTIAGMLIAAAAVGVGTVLFQTLTANRVLTPGIMGYDAIFLTIQVVIAFFLGSGFLVGLPVFASWIIELVVMAGAIVALYWWLFVRRRLDLHLIVLVGLVLGTLFRSISAFLQRLLDPDTFATVQNFLFASFTSTDDEMLLPTAIVVGLALASLWPIRRSLDVLTLGTTPAIGLGVAHRRIVMHVVIAVSAMVAASTALVGPVTFFGLLVVNLAYSAVGHRHTASIPASIAIGVLVLVAGQLVLDRVLDFNSELPVVIEFLGGIVFVVLVLTGRAR